MTCETPFAVWVLIATLWAAPASVLLLALRTQRRMGLFSAKQLRAIDERHDKQRDHWKRMLVDLEAAAEKIR